MGRIYWLWVVLSTALLSFWPSIIHADSYGVPPRMNEELFFPHLVLVLGHFVAGVMLRLVWTKKQSLLLSDIVLIVLSSEGLSLLLLMLVNAPYSRGVLLGTIVLSLACFVSIYATIELQRRGLSKVRIRILSIVAVAIIVIVLVQPSAIRHLFGSSTADEAGDVREQNVIDSAFYLLRMVEYAGGIPRPSVRGGGMDVFGDGFIVVTGEGTFYEATFSDGDTDLEVRELRMRAPSNAAEFNEDAPEGVLKEYFGVADVLVQRTPDATRIFTSHHFWKRELQCYVLRVSKMDWSDHEVDLVEQDRTWEVLYETDPCIDFEADSLRGHQLMMSGGRMQLLNDAELLVTVGDHGFDKNVYGPIYAQTADASYGKTIRVRIEDGSATPFSTGHRNPQGLHITPEGTIWSTEHGPRGGDELNVLVEKSNYGWPYVTYGTEYHKHEWLEHAEYARRGSFQSPVYSWVPSVGISNVLQSSSPLFPAWNGDLLVASLKGHTLFRVQVENNRTVVVEPIKIGGRIRDLAEDAQGRLVLWTDPGSFLVIEPIKESSDASSLFLTQCANCHQVDNDNKHLIGPDLGGVFGRKIGSAPGYRYSNALADLSGEWDDQALRSFLKNPRAFAPGTTMDFEGLSDNGDLDRMVAYIKSLD